MIRIVTALSLIAAVVLPTTAAAQAYCPDLPDLAVSTMTEQSSSENWVMGRLINRGGGHYHGQGNARLVISRDGQELTSLAIPSAPPSFDTQILARVPRDDRTMHIFVEVVFDTHPATPPANWDCNASNNRTSVRFD